MSGAAPNDPAAPVTAARSPRLRAVVAGQVTAAVWQAEVESNNHYRADTFSASLTADSPGAQTLAWWSDQDSITVELQVSLDGGTSWASVFTGEVDGMDADPLHPTVHVHGRDLSRRLIDSKTQETFANQTSSQVAATLAGRRGLTPVVTATATPVSRFYGADHDHLTGDQFSRTITEWDLLVYLAQHEGFDVFVSGTELHFQPETPMTAAPWVARLDRSGPSVTGNVMNPRFERSLTLAKDIEVWVRSWNAGKKSGFTAKSGGAKGSGPATSATQRIVVVRPNLTQDQADKLAQSIREDATRHERLFSFELPGETVLDARGLVRLEGSGTSWDQTYYVDGITRTIGPDGFRQTVKCKNHSVDNESVPA